MKRSLVFIGTLIVSPLTFSAEWVLDLTGSPAFEYDDNVLLSEDEEDSFSLSISPTVVLSRAVENMFSSLSLGYSVERYSSLKRLNSENPFIRFSSNYALERASFAISASYIENNARNDALEDTGDFATDATSKTRAISPSFSYQLTERDSLSGSFSYSEKQYSSTGFEDNETESLSLGWTRRITERFRAGLNSSVTNFQTDGLTFSTDDYSYNLSTNMSYQLSEVWAVNADIGFRRLENERTDNTGGVVKGSSTGQTFNISTTFDEELDAVSISYTRALSPSSTGAVNEQDALNFNWTHNLSEKLTASFSAGYAETRTASEQSSNEKRENINLAPSLKWRIDPKLTIGLGYAYKQQKRSTAADVDSNAVTLTLLYDWDGLRVSR